MLGSSNILRIMKLTTKEEDYLETIYRLACESDTVGISDVAHARDVTLPTVISAVSRLKENGLVSQRHYGKIFLSDLGQEMARDIYRTHSALKLFLTDVLQLPAQDSEVEACKLEHAISDETIKRLVIFMDAFHKCVNREELCNNIFDVANGKSSSELVQKTGGGNDAE